MVVLDLFSELTVGFAFVLVLPLSVVVEAVLA